MTPGYRVKLYGESDGLVVAALVTLTHPELGVLQLSTDPTQRIRENPAEYGTISRAEEYRFMPVEVGLPLDEAGSEPSASLIVQNVDRRLIPLIRVAADSISVKVEIIDPADPDEVQRTFDNLMVVKADYDAMEVVLGLRVDMLQSEPYPAGRFTPGGFRFLF